MVWRVYTVLKIACIIVVFISQERNFGASCALVIKTRRAISCETMREGQSATLWSASSFYVRDALLLVSSAAPTNEPT